MNGLIVDSSVILDIFQDDPAWGDWSQSMLDWHSVDRLLYINPVIYTEVSIGFKRIEELEKAIDACGFKMLQIPKEALFLAGKAYLSYRKNKGSRTSVLPDFYIGAHAAVSKLTILTRDTARINTYFPKVNIISPPE